MKLIKLDYTQVIHAKPYFDRFKSEISDINFTNLMMWRDKYNFHYIIVKDFLFIVNIKGDHLYFSQPIGDYSRPEKVYAAFSEIKSICEKEGKPLIIKKADNDFVSLMKAYDEKFELKYSEDEQDYIYDFESLKNLRGKKYHKKKNHINKFLKTYENWQFKWYEDTDFTIVDDLLMKWLEVKTDQETDPNLSFEYNGIIDILKHKALFDLKIGLLFVDDQLAGFIMGEIINNDTLLVHIEKGDTQFESIFTAIGHFLYEQLDQVDWINREQDLGIEGLRKSKLSYHPVRFITKNELWF